MEEKNKKKQKKKTKKIIGITLSCVIGIPLLTVLSYLGYVVFSYHRIGDISLEVNGASEKGKVESNKELTLTTYNIGFGAYSPDYTFFRDAGYDKGGNETRGKYGKGISKEDVTKNTNGSISLLKELKSDFFALQEVDVDADRSYHINQKEEIEEERDGYDNSFAINFDSAYLFYPFTDPHGKSKAGRSTYSKYEIQESERKQYTISDGFSKFMDLDRCFSVNRRKADNGKEFILINSHRSAYDEGGKIRNTQIKELHSFRKAEADKGNYVIAAGDFNHDLLTDNPRYPQYNSDVIPYQERINQQKPDWINYRFDENKTSPYDDGFTIYAADNEPSCRGCDVVWERGSTFVSTVDGFIVSDNIEIKEVSTLKVGTDGFLYSDHQPSTLTFVLK